MNFLATVFKYIIFISNTIFLLCGIDLIMLGCVILRYFGNVIAILNVIPIFLIVMGCIVFMISFFGAWGAVRENFCCIVTYAVFMVILLSLQITLIVWLAELHHNFLSSVASLVDSAWTNDDAAENFPMLGLQLTFDCCGKDSYKDYPDTGKNVSTSCCGWKETTSCPATEYMTKPGCKKLIVGLAASYTDFIVYSGIPVAIVEFLAFAFAAYLAYSVRCKQQRKPLPSEHQKSYDVQQKAIKVQKYSNSFQMNEQLSTEKGFNTTSGRCVVEPKTSMHIGATYCKSENC